MPQRVLIILSVSILVLSFQFVSDWTKEKEDDGIVVYTRTITGKSYLEYKTDFKVYAILARVKEVITAVDSYKEWMPSTVESRIVRKKSDSVFYAYTVTETPWPASSRDLAFKGTVQKVDANTFRITYTEAPTSVPENKKYVRIKGYRAIWELTQQSPDYVMVSFRFTFDPGSTYPNWMIKNGIVSARIDVAKSLRKRV